ncbi:MAG: PfkB family carbohydrate kinase [Oscillospiraceae bacterium]
MAKTQVLVVGAVNMDIGGVPLGPLVQKDSNPGRVRLSLGGVGRNIAHNLSLFGLDVSLITAFGEDLYAQKIAASCAALGIDTAASLQVPGGATSTYLFIADGGGDMALAVSDMEIYENLTPAVLSQRRELLEQAALVVLDTNLPADTLRWIGETIKVPIFADPVSTAKAGKLTPILGKLHTLKPNRLEAELLSGVPITDEASLEKAAARLLDTGLRRVFISLGDDGVYAADHSSAVHLPICPAKVVNATGCGDAFMAALCWAYLQNLDLSAAARAGTAAAALTMEGEETINPILSSGAVLRRMNETGGQEP